MFYAPRLIFGGTEGVESRFHVLRAPRLVLGTTVGVNFRFYFLRARTLFGGTEGVGPHFHGLRAGTHFRRYRWRRPPLSCFARPESFSAVPRESAPVFIFCARLDSFSAVPRASGPVFKLCAPGLIFGGTEGVGSRFHVLHTRTCFQRYRGRCLSFSCFALPKSFSAVPRVSGPFSGFARADSFSAVLRASAPVFILCASGLGFGGTKGVGSRFHVLQYRTQFRRYRGRRLPFSCFSCPD
jgi:hypothetical protein